MGNATYLMVFAIAAAGLFAAPQMLATYAGTHSLQGNADSDPGLSTKGSALNCLECHQYIGDETNVNNGTKGTYSKHAAPAKKTNYTTYMGYYGDDYNTTPANTVYSGIDAKFNGPWFTARRNNSGATVKLGDILARSGTDFVNASNPDPLTAKWYAVWRDGALLATPVEATDDLSKGYSATADWRGCLFCHRSAFFYGGTHTRITVKSCTNIYCHGDGSGQTYNQGSRMTDLPEYYKPGSGFSSKAGFVGNAINNSADAHSNWFRMSKEEQTNKYYNYDTDPNNATKLNDDYFTCLGCHSHASMTLKVKRPNTFELTTDKVPDSAQSLTYEKNYTEFNESTSYKTGSAWKP